ncbi:hypothetical protein JOC86_001952 [Bacillus pakistanensis]|uniref:DUF3231 family protein n=1 Tax=Rossellomorea pakistanensis TaxID=992288 RepID=A0ABS2NC25_9BACI|nr:DUF3231 family protein [Bacillus pakistanensis]MBM7585410.1 hypothetical protein [Bacillus pakistanensis]
MESEHNIKLSATEISQLWSAYMNSSMSKCLFTYFLETVEDTQIRLLLEQSLELADTHLVKLTKMFQREGYPLPYGFKVEEDVNKAAPRLFSDSFILYFVYNMGIIAFNFYSLSKTLTARSDINTYFSECVLELNQFDTEAKNLLLSKGLYIRSPYLNPPKEASFVKSQKFMAGWFSEKRPLSAIEITNVFANLQRNALGEATMMGFSQGAQSKEVGRFMVRGRDIAHKHTEIFSSILGKDHLPVPMSWDTEITDSRVSPFSDKLMMFSTTSLIALSIGFYGTSASTSARKDLSLHFVRLSAELGKYAEDGATIMINNGWLEEPPLSEDRDKLANT